MTSLSLKLLYFKCPNCKLGGGGGREIHFQAVAVKFLSAAAERKAAEEHFPSDQRAIFTVTEIHCETIICFIISWHNSF